MARSQNNNQPNSLNEYLLTDLFTSETNKLSEMIPTLTFENMKNGY